MAWVFIALLGLSAGAKALSYAQFTQYLIASGMFPVSSAGLVARAVVAAEIATALLLVWPRLRRFGFVAASGIFSAFAVFHGVATVLGDIKPCRCLVVELVSDAFWDHIIMFVFCAGAVALSWVGVRRSLPTLGPIHE